MAVPPPDTEKVQTGVYYSAPLGREQRCAYILPPGIETEPDRRYPLLLLLHGRTGSYLDWPAHTRLARWAAAYDLIIACPDGDNGWYTNSWDGAARYEDDLIEAFLPHLQAALPLLPPGRHWAIGGLSMGGYGAVKTALRHPSLFALALSHSGAFEVTREPGAHPVFGDPQQGRALRRASNVFALAEDMLSRFPPQRPRLYIDCGTEDPLIEANRRFHAHLHFIGYHHTYHEMPGYHTWPYWDRALRTALPTIAQLLGKSTSEVETCKNSI